MCECLLDWLIHIVTCHQLNAGLYLQAQKYIQSLPFMPQQDLEKIFRGANPLGGWCAADWIINWLNSIERLWKAAEAQVALSILQIWNRVTQVWPFGFRLPTISQPSFTSLCASVSVSCRLTEAYAGSGLWWEDLGQRGSVPPLLLTVPWSRRRAGGTALRSNAGE